MKNGIMIDSYTLERTTDIIRYIRFCKILRKHGMSVPRGVIAADLIDETYYAEMEMDFFDLNTEYILGKNIEKIVANDKDWPGIKYFQDLIEYFNPEDYTVLGYLISEDYLYKYYQLCKEYHIDIEKTKFYNIMLEAGTYIDTYYDECTYFELVIPENEFIEEFKTPLVLFYTSTVPMTPNFIDLYLTGLEYAKKQVEIYEEKGVFPSE